jgi:hypothetical protein
MVCKATEHRRRSGRAGGRREDLPLFKARVEGARDVVLAFVERVASGEFGGGGSSWS